MSDSNFDDEYLIELARQSKIQTADEYDLLDDIEQFIHAVGISESTSNTEAMNIHWVYLKWCKRHGKKPYSQIHFGRLLSKKFKSVSSSGGRTYKIDKEPFEFSTEEWWKMRHFYAELRKLIAKEYRNKKSRKKYSEKKVQSGNKTRSRQDETPEDQT